jgi:hypothetical protein
VLVLLVLVLLVLLVLLLLLLVLLGRAACGSTSSPSYRTILEWTGGRIGLTAAI